MKSLPAHAIRSLVIARKKLVGQRVMLENQIRGLAVNPKRTTDVLQKPDNLKSYRHSSQRP
ncbi:hypothetical protein BQ8482_300044 [Mesorhizobium delmotii]|uniref:Uncharacterized protein n=1 Tax=Mesorhizobium delmotii TaxID=1631247 RepID=A0A2P9ANF8_9HYPH|nr:hypothetical protein BQ8482_300044 [Mesorhizobium delmotii]